MPLLLSTHSRPCLSESICSRQCDDRFIACKVAKVTTPLTALMFADFRVKVSTN